MMHKAEAILERVTLAVAGSNPFPLIVITVPPLVVVLGVTLPIQRVVITPILIEVKELQYSA